MKFWLGGLGAGVLAGILAGLVGVGGGIIIVPILIYFFKLDQHTAQGTSLAMLLPPTGILAFMKYYQSGHVEWRLAITIAVGVVVGGYFGGAWAQQINQTALRKGFAVVLAATAVKMFFQK